jgi:integrase
MLTIRLPVNLTERLIKSLQPTQRDLFAWDAALPGFGVRVKPSGRKSYVMQYRTRAGRSRRYTLGSVASYRLEQARAEAREWQVKIARGADPAEERKTQREAKTIAELAERYLAEHVRVHNKPRTAAEVARIVATRIKPKLGRIPVPELTRGRVKDWHQAMHATPYEANRALAYCSKMLSLATREWELRPDNPCLGIKRFPEVKLQRFLDGSELERLGKALAEAAHARLERPAIILAIRLLALTGCRRSEILTLTWDRVDLAKGVLWLTEAKAGARAVPLASPAIAVLTAAAYADARHAPVCQAANGKPLTASSLGKAWRRICQRARITNARLHDLRHTVGTYAGSTGLNAFLVRDLLGHKTLAMTGRYVERNADPLRAAAEAVSSQIAAAMAGTSADVVPLAVPAKRA